MSLVIQRCDEFYNRVEKIPAIAHTIEFEKKSSEGTWIKDPNARPEDESLWILIAGTETLVVRSLRDNADFIVQAKNTFPDIVELLEALLREREAVDNLFANADPTWKNDEVRKVVRGSVEKSLAKLGFIDGQPK